MAFEGGPFVFRINDNGSGPNLLLQVCVERGWREYNENGILRDNWNLWWRTSGFPVNNYKQLKNWQFTNHIPKGSSICRKDNLARHLKCMRKVYGSIYDISPPGYNLPLEYNKLVAECARQKQKDEDCVWICKPAGQSQGKGIFLFREEDIYQNRWEQIKSKSGRTEQLAEKKLKMLSDLVCDTNAVVQRYIEKPFLIGGYKFDLRLYVCIPSFHPLTVYLYREGLVRFSTEKFSLSDLDNPFCHLTNSSLNKQGSGYTKKKDCVGSGCKWTLKQLRHFFGQTHMSDWLLWQRVANLVVLTVLSQITCIPNTANCFELFGFDVLVDSTLRPWLLEVNLSPALGNDCDVDTAVKKPMLHDLFDLLGLPVCNTGLSLFTIWSSNNCQQRPSYLDGNYNSTREHDKRSTKSSALTVVAAASKWKRCRQRQQAQQSKGHQQKNSNLGDTPSHRTAGSSVPKTRKKSALHNNTNVNNTSATTSSHVSSVSGTGHKTKSSSVKNYKLSSSSTKMQYVRYMGGDCGGRTYVNGSHSSYNVNDQLWKYGSFLVDRSKMENRGFRGHTKRSHHLLWGNGKDWRSPPASEGDWVRIYPFDQFNQSSTDDIEPLALGVPSPGNKEVKSVVMSVNRYNKMAKEICRRVPDGSDEEYNILLQQGLGLTADIWLPPK